MWKALIKLVESWSYRCPHDWEFLAKTEVWPNGKDADLPDHYKYTYRCTKCGEPNIIRS